MRRILRSHIPLFLLLLCSVFEASAQEAGVSEENVFRLLQADRAQQMEQYSSNYRIVQGNARFLHNNTYLLCDSASWNVDGHIIQAFGNVQIIQDQTALKSETMIYLIDENLAKFRGGVVELIDKDGNVLRTSSLDYNTRDSVGTFILGGAVQDTSGNVIESKEGIYDAKQNMFTFRDQVELYMDSIEIKTSELRYLTQESKAIFGKNTLMWRGEGFIRSDAGSYKREQALSYFADNVYGNDPQYEAWTDELYYNQKTGKVNMYKNSQILDTLHKSFYLADRMEYVPSPDDSLELWKDRITMTLNPAVVYCGENENHETDTLFFRGDTIQIHSRLRCDIAHEEIEEGEKLIADMEFDAIAKVREDLAVEREKKRLESLREAGLLPPEGINSVEYTNDSVPAPENIIPAPADTLSAPLDSTPIRFVTAYRNVRIFRSDVQSCCDSIAFSETDSIARLFGKPILWNAVKNQLTAETMYLLMKNGNLYRGSMITDSWVVSKEDSLHFHQIKSAEMLGYFYDNQLYRFDALGGVNAVFYLADNGVVSTVNIKESKALTALIKDGNARRLLYIESIKSDAHPIGELPIEKQRLKDFEWRAKERPVSRATITDKALKTTEREDYSTVRRPLFNEVNKYFDNCMVGITGETVIDQIQLSEDVSVSGEILEISPLSTDPGPTSTKESAPSAIMLQTD